MNQTALPFSDDVISGDIQTSVSLNYEWRKIIASALEAYYFQGQGNTGFDNEDKLSDFLIDLYD